MRRQRLMGRLRWKSVLDTIGRRPPLFEKQVSWLDKARFERTHVVPAPRLLRTPPSPSLPASPSSAGLPAAPTMPPVLARSSTASPSRGRGQRASRGGSSGRGQAREGRGKAVRAQGRGRSRVEQPCLQRKQAAEPVSLSTRMQGEPIRLTTLVPLFSHIQHFVAHSQIQRLLSIVSALASRSGRGRWCFPGGHAESRDEGRFAAVARACQQERVQSALYLARRIADCRDRVAARIIQQASTRSEPTTHRERSTV